MCSSNRKRGIGAYRCNEWSFFGGSSFFALGRVRPLLLGHQLELDLESDLCPDRVRFVLVGGLYTFGEAFPGADS